MRRRLSENGAVDAVIAILEPQRREWNAVAMESKVEGADHGREGLQHAEEEVGVSEKLDVGEAVLLAVTRLAQEEVGFGCFKTEGEGGKDIGDGADEDPASQAEGQLSASPSSGGKWRVHLDVREDLG